MKKTSELIWQDTQHQTLFKLLNELKSETADTEIVNKLIEYAENHFQLEEAYMKKLNYPLMKEHIQYHNKFREEFRQMSLSKGALDAKTKELMSIYLTEWLTRHIFGIDKKFEAFVLKSDYK